MVPENHDHWAVGWVAGVLDPGLQAGSDHQAFRKYHELAQRLADYPVLDEEDYGRREYEDTISNLADAAWRLGNQYDLPKGWEPLVYDWLAENDCPAIENTDDRGGFPSEDQLGQRSTPWAMSKPQWSDLRQSGNDFWTPNAPATKQAAIRRPP